MFLGKFVFAYFFLAALYSIYKCLHISIQMHICWNLSIFLIGMFHLDTLAPIVFFMMSLLIVLYAIFRIIRKQRLVRAEEVG
jgi:hypothetical protein